MKVTGLALPIDLMAQIDEKRGLISRSKFIATILTDFLNDKNINAKLKKLLVTQQSRLL
jgi:metal-responsive CopG/Arc/MetJ family transcriptional regulator